MAIEVDGVLLQLFEDKCSECHKSNEEDPVLGKDTNLTLLRRSDWVKPGRPEDSTLYKLVVLPHDDKKRMPRSRGKAGDERFKEPLSPDEKKVIHDWIGGTPAALPSGVPAFGVVKGGGGIKPAAVTVKPLTVPATASGERPFISEDEINELVLTDLKAGGVQDRQSWRYLTLHNYWNQRDIHADELVIFAQAISKLANSLSDRPKIVQPKSLDERRIVFRIDMRDYNIDPIIWRNLATHYPFGLDRGTSKEAEIEKLVNSGKPSREIEKSAGKEWPILRADWWTFMMAQPPFYYQVLRFPGSGTAELARNLEKDKLGRDLELERTLLNRSTVEAGPDGKSRSIAPFAASDLALQRKVLRKAFERSQVSQGNRVIERIPLDDKGGYYWKSFDFNSDRKQVNAVLNPADVFRAPLGPQHYGLTTDPRLRFRADGGEIIFSLPNGLQAYMLTDGQGKRLDKAPFDVVQDKRHPRRTILAGVSCMSCHADGLNSLGIKDEVGPLADDVAPLTRDRETIKMLYGAEAQQRLQELTQQDMKRFRMALDECGVTSAKEPVGELYFHFISKPVEIANLGAELGTDMPEVGEKLKRSASLEVRSNASRPAIERLVFLNLFPAMAKELGLGTPRDFTPVAVAETEGSFGQTGANGGLLGNPLKGGTWKPPGASASGSNNNSTLQPMKMRRVITDDQ